MVVYIFDKKMGTVSPDDVQDGYYSTVVDRIKAGNNEYLLENNINQRDSITENEEVFMKYYLNMRVAGEVDQFLEGIKSVWPNFSQYYCCLKRLFVAEE